VPKNIDDDDADLNDRQEAEEQEVELPVEEKKKKDTDDHVEVVAEEDSHVELSGAAEQEARHERETSKERRERAKRAKERDRGEIQLQKRIIDDLRTQTQTLSGQMEMLARHAAETRAQGLDARSEGAKAEAEHFARIQAAALTKNEGTDAVAAERFRREAEDREHSLKAEAARLRTAATAPIQQQNQPPPYVAAAREFLKDKPWYDATGRDEDSLIVMALDKGLTVEGRLNPNTQEYWDELDKKVRERLPHKFEDDGEDEGDQRGSKGPAQRTKKGPPVAGGRSSSGTPGTIVLSSERVRLLKEANLWDDPKTRARMAKKYFEYDQEHKAASH
jgi:hypothetical protein